MREGTGPDRRRRAKVHSLEAMAGFCGYDLLLPLKKVSFF